MHDRQEDDAYLTKVFGKYSTLGLDAAGEPNGRRALTKHNAEMATREVLRYWKGMKGDALDEYIKANFDGAWHNVDASNKDSLDVRSAYSWMRNVAGEE